MKKTLLIASLGLLNLSLQTQAEEVNTWTAKITGVTSLEDLYLQAPVCVDNAGSTYTTGQFTDVITIGSTTLEAVANSAYLAKYNADGTAAWAIGLSGAATITSVTTDESNNVYIAGTFADVVKVGSTDGKTQEIKGAENETNKTASFIASYNANGELQAVRTFLAQTNEDAANSGLYFPDNAYYEEAQGSGKITALLPVKGQLAVIKEDSDGKNAVYLHTPQDTENDLAPRIYPSTYGIVDNGCINPECYTVFGGEALYLSRNGLMSVSSTDLSDERSIEFRSSNVFSDKKVNKDAFMWKDDDFLYIQNGKDDPTVYIADKRNRTYNKNTLSQEFEWFVWDGIYISDTDKNYPVLSCAESDGKVYFNFWDPDSSTGAIGAEDAGCVYMLTYDRDDSGKYEDEAGYISVSEVTLKKTVRPLPV